jgi:phosphopantetheine--protein transferase-like protein
MLLASILGTTPQTIEFDYGSLGKPYLRSNVDLHFNVSHSQDWALMAFAMGSPVGVDLEFYDRRINDEAIASQLLSESELEQWSLLPKSQQSKSLISAWVSKEAILKSLGLGITTSLRQLELPMPLPSEGFNPVIGEELINKAEATKPSAPAQDFNALEWKLRFIDSIPHASAAACYTSRIRNHTARHWDEL